jgi:hypothetical protein
MKNFKFRYVIYLAILVLLGSCIQPPEGMENVNILAFAKEVMDKNNTMKGDENKQNEYLGGIAKNLEKLFVLYNNSTINIKSREAKTESGDLGYSLANNRFKLLKSVYITFEKKDMIFSFDNVNWYSSKSDSSKKIEAINIKINYDTSMTDNNLYIAYDAVFKMGRNPLIAKVTPGKEVVTLNDGMVLSSPDVDMITNNLEKMILLIPANSIIAGNMVMNGNIMKSFTTEDSMVLKSLTDIYIFIKKNMFSLSFDHKNWNANILSFDIKPIFEARVSQGNVINFNIIVDANYDKDKVSLSIVKLLLTMRR